MGRDAAAMAAHDIIYGGEALIFYILLLVIGTVLMFVLFYGIGFILNMLIKTTWLPVYLYIIVLLSLNIYWKWGADGSLWSILASYSVDDYIHALGGLAGAYLSGVTLRFLREKGYQMF